MKILNILKMTKKQFIFSIMVVLVLVTVIPLAIRGTSNGKDTEPEPTVPDTVNVKVQRTYVFVNGEGTPVDMQEMTTAWASEAGTEKRYDLTDAERWEVASVVTAEAQGEPFAGKVAVAQCILQGCEDDAIRPDEAVARYKYCKARPEPSEEALEAVAAVFDFGHTATDEPIKYFYAPARCTSSFHESQGYVLTINNHKFFKEAE